MRVVLLAVLLFLAFSMVPVPASAETSGCVIIDQPDGLPIEVTEPMSCTFSCDEGQLWMAVTLHSDRGAIRAGCGTWGMAVAFSPECVAGHYLPSGWCTFARDHWNYRAETTGVCLITPHDGLQVFLTPMHVSHARCDAAMLGA